jgi:hypothetical protein
MYSLVTFSDVPYSEAWQKGQKHNQYFQKRNDLREIAELIDKGDADEVLVSVYVDLSSKI